jgi:ribosomal protein S8
MFFKNSKISKKGAKKPPVLFSMKNFFRTYLSALKNKALFFNYGCYISKVTSDFLICLEKNSRIAGYKISLDNQNIKVFLSYDLTQSKPLIPKITYYAVQGRTRSANIKQLQKFQTQNPNTLTLIRTNFGIRDLQTCLIHRWGGEFLVNLT